jgi:hypothetical protein
MTLVQPLTMMTMRTAGSVARLALPLVLAACGGGAAPDAERNEVDSDVAEAPVYETPAPAAESAPAAAGAGTAQISLTGDGVSMSGEYPAILCGGPYFLGEGMSYQTQAEGWQITIASENREAGEVALNTPRGTVNVVVTVNGPGMQFVRGPRNGGSLVITDDFRRAEADLELRSLVGGQTGRLAATFTCE